MSNYNKLRAIIQAYPNSNEGWIANDVRSDTKDVDYIGKRKGQGKRKDQGKGNGKEAKPDKQGKEWYMCGKKGYYESTKTKK